MGWNNVLPVWMIFHERAELEALLSCAFPEEWCSGMSRELPSHLQGIDRACMKSYEEGGWNSSETVKKVVSRVKAREATEMELYGFIKN